MPVGGTRVRVGSGTPAPRGTTRRWLLGAGTAGVVAGVSASGGLLAACGIAPGSSGGGDESKTASRAPVTIDILTRSGVAAQTGHSQWYAQVAKNTFTPQTNITVNLFDGDPDVTTKLNVMSAAGTPPDGSWYATTSDGAGGREQTQRGVFKPMDDLIKKDSKFDLKGYIKALIDIMSVGGKVYGLPLMAHYGTNVWYYNKSKWDGAGVYPPADGNWTIDEFVAGAQKLVNKAQDIWAYRPEVSIDQYGVFWVRQFGGEVLDEAGKKCLLDTPECRAGLEWVNNLQTKFQLIDDFYRSPNIDTMFESQGSLASRSQTPGLVSEYKKPGQTRVKFDLGIAVFAKGPKGHGTQATGQGMGITKLDHQAEVWEWIKTLTNRENGVAQVFGGAGSPGGRVECWTDPKLAEVDPIYGNMVKVFPQGAGSIRWPANNHRVDLVKAIDDNLAAYFKGQVSLNEATTKAVQDANAILAL
jgi:ABC-type glycerol-3-phosphate transport system substrate-binding protein